MTDKAQHGGPAFAHGNPEQGGNEGMSLRDYFAGQAIAGTSTQFISAHSAARAAYELADAMLEARK